MATGTSEPVMRFSSGQVLTAADLNRLAELVARAVNVSGGPGVIVRKVGGGVSIALAEPVRVRDLPCVVSARSVSTDDWPDNVTYTVKPQGHPDHPGWADLTPKLRWFTGTGGVPKLTPAPVGAKCAVRLGLGGDGDLRPELMWVAEEEIVTTECAAEALRTISLVESEILDHVVTDRDGAIVTDRDGHVMGDRFISAAVAAAYLAPVVTDRTGRVATDRDGSVLLDRTADAACRALWAEVLTDRLGRVVTDRMGRIMTRRAGAGVES